MPRPARMRSEMLSAPAPRREEPTAFIASAVNLTMKKSGGEKKPKKITTEQWQQEVRHMYDVIPEFRYGTNWVGNLISRAKLLPLVNGKATDNAEVVDLVNALYGDEEGRGDMLRMIGVHLSTVGEVYVVGVEGVESDEWHTVSAADLKATPMGYELFGEVLDKKPLIIKMWMPHPFDSMKPDSAARPCLPVLGQLEGLQKRTVAELESRLTGAGLLLIPNEITLPSQPVINEDGDTAPVAEGRTQSVQVLEMLMDTFTKAIQNPSSAAAQVPIVMQMPGEHIKSVTHLTFWSEFAEKSVELRSEAIHRLALGLDMPPEALEGTGDMNHWNSWQMEEAAIKANSEPLLARITQALTVAYLRPLLIDGGMSEEDAAKASIGYDSSALRVRPNRSKEAGELYDRGVLSQEALLRENGFVPEDAMGPDEFVNWLTRKVASGQTMPEMVAAALTKLGVDIPAPTDSESEPVHEARPTPSLVQHPTRDIPVEEESEAAAAAAASVLVYRALERAGNRLKKRLPTEHIGVAASQVYQFVPIEEGELATLLDGAWSCPPEFTDGLPMERLDAYTRTLMLTRTPHDSALMRKYLTMTSHR